MSTQRWHIDRIELRNFRNNKELNIDFGDQVTLLIGENGAGKTAILDAISIMLWAPLRSLSSGRGARHIHARDAHRFPIDLASQSTTAMMEPLFPVVIRAEGMLDGHDYHWERSLKGKRGRTTWGDIDVRNFGEELANAAASQGYERAWTTLPVIAYYGVERLIGEVPKKGFLSLARSSAYDLALDPRSDLKRLSAFLEMLDEQIVRAKAFGDPEPAAALAQFAAIEKACDIVLESSQWSQLRWNSSLREVTFNHPRQGRLPLSYLATGPRIAAGLTIDIASRMARANPHLAGDQLLNGVPGIVMIDEVDLHLHPTWQQRIVPALRQAFPAVQFILTTHSPQVISTVEAENIRILDDGRVRTPEFSKGLRSNTVLERIQGTDPRPRGDLREDFDTYLRLVHSGRGGTEEAQSLRKDLDRKIGGAEYNQELIDADVILEFQGWDD